MNLQDVKWSEFSFEDLFVIERGTSKVYKKDLKSGKFPYVSASALNCGITNYINKSNRVGNLISLAYDGNVGEAFYQPYKWFASEKIVSLNLKNRDLNKYIALFIATSIRTQKVKFGYSYKWSVGRRMQKSKILLPIKLDGTPDYEFMENYMKEQEEILINKYKKYISNNLYLKKSYEILKTIKWKEFYIKDVFEYIRRGKRLKTNDHIYGKMPYISSTATNNGVDNFIGNKNGVRIFENCLTLANSGSVGACFYQPFKFVASDHITQLSNNRYSKYVYLFLAAMLVRISTKYSFNREINDNRIQREKILLPVKSDETPYYELMENYMKYEEYKQIKIYFDFIEMIKLNNKQKI